MDKHKVSHEFPETVLNCVCVCVKEIEIERDIERQRHIQRENVDLYMCLLF